LVEKFKYLEETIEYKVEGSIGDLAVRDEMVYFKKILTDFVTWQNDIGLADNKCYRMHYQCRLPHYQCGLSHILGMYQEHDPTLFQSDFEKKVEVDDVIKK
jgi:hypothetical protein